MNNSLTYSPPSCITIKPAECVTEKSPPQIYSLELTVVYIFSFVYCKMMSTVSLNEKKMHSIYTLQCLTTKLAFHPKHYFS